MSLDWRLWRAWRVRVPTPINCTGFFFCFIRSPGTQDEVQFALSDNSEFGRFLVHVE
jgi:hypothetical protein